MAADPQRLGGLAWVRRTNGRLTARERRRLLAAIALGQWQNALGRLKLASGRLPAAAARVDLDTFAVPDSRFAGEAPHNVKAILARHPRGEFKPALVALVRAEAAALPSGRFGLLVRCGLPLAVRLAPFES